MSCPDDLYEEGRKRKKKKDEIEELFGDEDDEEEKECRPKDEFDELYEQGQGDPEDVYANEDFENYDDGVAD